MSQLILDWGVRFALLWVVGLTVAGGWLCLLVARGGRRRR